MLGLYAGWAVVSVLFIVNSARHRNWVGVAVWSLNLALAGLYASWGAWPHLNPFRTE